MGFLGGAALLTAAVAVSKLLGALYKIPLGNLLGSRGMGCFQAAYNVYGVLLTLSTAGLPLAMSRLIAQSRGRPRRQRRIFHVALALFLALGLVGSGVMLTFPRQLAGLLHNELAAPSIRVLAPALLAVCLLSAIRGYTQGQGQMLPTAVSQVVESAGKLVVGLGLTWYLLTVRGVSPEIGAAGALTALLKDALDPNLVQTLENNPAIIHGGPFANIAHGCNSVMATKLSLSLADYVITEAGFGADLGAEKFLDIKCRYAGIAPSACVLVATVRALKSHGGVAKADLNQPNLEAVKAGASNLVRHIDNLKNGFGLPVVVAINAFPTDTPEEQAYVEQVCAEQGVSCVLSEVFAKGGEGGKALAEKVLEVMEDRPIQYVYPLEMPLKQKVEAIAKKIYRADGVNFSAAASKTLAELTELGYGDLPVCIAKTQYSFSDNAKLTGAPTGFTMEVREVRLAAGAGFVVVICGNIMTMPGLPKKPAAVNIDVDAEGKITGLF